MKKSYKITVSLGGPENLEVETNRITKRKMNKMIAAIVNKAYSSGCSIVNVEVEVMEE